MNKKTFRLLQDINEGRFGEGYKAALVANKDEMIAYPGHTDKVRAGDVYMGGPGEGCVYLHLFLSENDSVRDCGFVEINDSGVIRSFIPDESDAFVWNKVADAYLTPIPRKAEHVHHEGITRKSPVAGFEDDNVGDSGDGA